MADRPQRAVKKPERFTYHLGESTVVKKLTKKRDMKLYDIEVTEVDKANKRLKTHYVSYSTQFDEQRSFGGDEESEYFHFLCSEKRFIPTDESIVDRMQSFHELLYREIKKNSGLGAAKTQTFAQILTLIMMFSIKDLEVLFLVKSIGGKWFTVYSPTEYWINFLVRSGTRGQ